MQLEVKQVWQGVETDPISSPSEAIPYLNRLDIRNSDREKFIVLHLDARNRVIAHEIASIGSQSASIVHPREVFKAAILKGANSIILAHNHPSGDPAPSRDDIDLTHRLREAGNIVGVEIIDHIIVAPPDEAVSLKETGIV